VEEGSGTVGFGATLTQDGALRQQWHRRSGQVMGTTAPVGELQGMERHGGDSWQHWASIRE
jgi:hypothetical protein